MGMAHHRILSMQLGSLCGVAISVSVAEILPDECTDTVWKVTVVDLLRSVIELMSVAIRSLVSH
jgi:hypothetical protein